MPRLESPIPTAPPEELKAVERLVDRILAAKARDAKADLPALRLRQAGGLTPEEIQIVEEA